MSSRVSTESRHKKILRTRVKVWGKFLLRAEETFNVDRAEQLIHNALDKKTSVQTTLKLYGDGLRVGENGVLAALHAEFILYSSIAAFISLREAPNLLALCSKNVSVCNVTVMQFKDMETLEIVCDLIDRQRGILTRSGAASLARSEMSSKPAPAAPAIKASAAPAAVQPPAPFAVTDAVATANVTVEAQPPQPPPPKPETMPAPEPVPQPEPPVLAIDATDASSNSNVGGLFEKRPFAAEITQPPEPDVTAVIVHVQAAKPDNVDDDDDHFRTSIVFGESTMETPAEMLERQRRMEAVIQMRTNSRDNGHVDSKEYIDAVILNYDEIEIDGTHAVFDTPDGPPIQLNESTENLRRRSNQLLVTANSSPVSGSRGSSRLVVTSFSSGTSDSPEYTRAASADAEPAYRTSTVIYRDEPLLDSPTERPRVTYVSNHRGGIMGGASDAAAPLSPQSHKQPMQLVRLVPVSSARRRIVQQQPQLFTIQPVSPRENGVHLVTK